MNAKDFVADNSVCHNCIDDYGLKLIVLDKGVSALCCICKTRNDGLSIRDLARTIDPFIREHFTIGEFYPYYDSEGDFVENYQEGQSIDSLLVEMIGEVEFSFALITSLIEGDSYDRTEGEEPFYVVGMKYEQERRRWEERDTGEWAQITSDFKKKHRYFNARAKNFFDFLFSDLDKLLAYDDNKVLTSVVKTLPKDTPFWRARNCSTAADVELYCGEPSKYLCPPPPGTARAGRMNADGISVFYGARDEQTCVSEMRPSIGSRTLVGLFYTKRELRILDFSLLEKGFDSRLSYFTADFISKRSKQSFMRNLHRLISQPVLPGRESDYIITQVLSEHLAQICVPQINGLMFRSSQKKGGINVVLFLDQDPPQGPELSPDPHFGMPIRYSGDQCQLYETRSVAFENAPIPTRRLPKWKALGENNRHPV